MKKKIKMWGVLLLAVGLIYGTASAEELPGEELRDYILMEADVEVLTEEELDAMSLQVVTYGKYEIYARHGMIFESRELAEYFGGQSWYFGFIDETDFPENMLNETELANLELLEQREEEAGDESYQLDQENYNFDEIIRYLSGENVTETAEMETETAAEAEPEEAGTEEPGETESETAAEAELEEAGTEEPGETESETAAEAETEGAEPKETEAPEAVEAGTEAKLVLEENTDAHGVNMFQDSENIAAETETQKLPEVSGQQVQNQEPQTMQVAVDTEYIFPDVNTRYLSESEVKALSLQAICYAKNEVYARHGRKFLSRELQEYFNSKSWYQGIIEPESFSDKVFNDFELKNIQLLAGCEAAIRSDGYQLDQPGYDITRVKTVSVMETMTVPGTAVSSSTVSDEEYLSQEYIFQDSDIRELTEAEVNGLSVKIVSYAVYEIYARRGCLFESQEIQQHFEQKSWYAGRIPQSDFSQDMFNQIEKSNITLLKNRRKALLGQ